MNDFPQEHTRPEPFDLNELLRGSRAFDGAPDASPAGMFGHFARQVAEEIERCAAEHVALHVAEHHLALPADWFEQVKAYVDQRLEAHPARLN